jgi:integral membrane protein
MPQPPVLKRYRVMAYVVGVMLLLLVFVAMPLKYWGHNSGAVKIVGPLHGALFVVYLLAVLQLAFVRRWPLLRTGLVMLGGVVPFLSFVTERRVVRDELTRTGG